MAIIALPLAVYRPASSGQPGTPAFAPVISRTSDVASPVQLSLVWAPERPIAARGLSGHIVTDVFVKVGQPIPCGGRLVEIDGEPLVSYCGARPLWRPLTAGVRGSDVEQLVGQLRQLGFLGASAPSAGALTAAIRAWQRSLALPETGVVDPARFIWTGKAVTPASVTVTTGQAVNGDLDLLTVAPELVSAHLTPASDDTTETVFNVDGVRQTFSLSDRGSISDLAGLGAVILATAPAGQPLPTTVAGQRRRATPLTVSAVPAAAIRTGPQGSCVVIDEGPAQRKLPVSVVSSEADAVLVTGDLPEGAVVALGGADRGC